MKTSATLLLCLVLFTAVIFTSANRKIRRHLVLNRGDDKPADVEKKTEQEEKDLEKSVDSQSKELEQTETEVTKAAADAKAPESADEKKFVASEQLKDSKTEAQAAGEKAKKAIDAVDKAEKDIDSGKLEEAAKKIGNAKGEQKSAEIKLGVAEAGIKEAEVTAAEAK